MKTTTTFVALAAAAGTSMAAPAEGNGLKFSVPAVKNGNQRHAMSDVNGVLRKFTTDDAVAVEQVIANRLSNFSKRGENATVITNPHGDDGVDTLYITEIEVGSPPQKLPMDFDTGSSDLWVFSTDTKKSQVSGQKLYKPSSSSTSKRQSGQTWGITYGDQSTCRGIVYTDKVSIGGAVVPDMAVESAQEVSAQFTKDSASSGLVGLANDRGNTIRPSQSKTWFGKIKDSLAAPLFTAALKHAAPGSYNFGYIDKSQYSGEIQYTKAYTDDLGHRLFDATGYQVGDGEFTEKTISGTADTGTSLLYLPDDVASAYWDNIESAYKNDLGHGQYLWTFKCNEDLPDFTFGIGNGQITVPGANMNYATNAPSTTVCVGGIGSIAGDIAIFGDVAMKGTFVVYDDAESRLGWAQGAN